MGIFTRLKDIASSNINSMLDRAEDPEKLIRLMIQEMEETLVEIKSACAGAMAGTKKVQREADAVTEQARQWDDKARLAVDKGREDLAREALVAKRRYTQRGEVLDRELAEAQTLVETYQEDIRQLENKLASVKEKRRMLVERHIAASHRKKANQDIRRAESAEVMARFEHLNNRVERMEAEAQLVNFAKKNSLENEFDRLAGDEEIERELAAIKRAGRGESQGTGQN